MAAKRRNWEASHRKTENGVPTRLYTDENPATTIKGTGYKDKKIAERTIYLTSQKGVRYKQYWTIKAMRERAAFHPHQTNDMREAMKIFDEWLKEAEEKKPPSSQERIELEIEWKEYWKLCNFTANVHSYDIHSTSKNDSKKAKDNLRQGRECLSQALALAQRKSKIKNEIQFALTAFTALFGSPGIHGYGTHTISMDSIEQSLILIDGMEGLNQLLPNSKITNIPLLSDVSDLESFKVYYNRTSNIAHVELEYSNNRITLPTLWNKMRNNNNDNDDNNHSSFPSSSYFNNNDQIHESVDDFSGDDNKKQPISISSWTCPACTFDHIGKGKQFYLTCELCETARSRPSTNKVESNVDNPNHNLTKIIYPSNAWGSLRPPSDRDIHGPRKRPKVFDKPTPMLEFLVVMDLEWTADERKKMEPICEITQLPSVVMKVVHNHNNKMATTVATTENTKVSTPENKIKNSPIKLPADLKKDYSCSNSMNTVTKADAYAISVFDTYVRPTLNPRLTKFSIDLTAITQKDVDDAPSIESALTKYMNWLKSLDLIDVNGSRKSNWCFVTWGDSDIMNTLRQELQYKSIRLPQCFDCWINLKNNSIYKKHYGREPKGGLRACVESIRSLSWQGRAHNGLVDSINTAKIVRHMVQTGFRFTRSTRGLDRNGVPFGQGRKRNEHHKV